MNILPKARNENIVVQNVDKEVLIYDLITNKAFCLNETSKIIFEACDGTTTFDELKRKHQFMDDLIFLAIDGLKRENLIEGEYQSKFAGVSRREAMRKVGFASICALPVIMSLIAPTAAQSFSRCLLTQPGNSTIFIATAATTPLAYNQAVAGAYAQCCSGLAQEVLTGCGNTNSANPNTAFLCRYTGTCK